MYISLLFFWLELGHLVVLKIFFVAAKNECLPLVQRRTHIETRTVAACDYAQLFVPPLRDVDFPFYATGDMLCRSCILRRFAN